MKKKFIATLLIMSVTISGCGASSNTKQPHTDTESKIANTESTPGTEDSFDSLGDVSVEKELFDVKLTIPADYAGEKTQEELDSEVTENGYKSATLNEDGSITYEMTKSQHKKMMTELKDNLNTALSEIIGSEDYPNFTDIKANDDFTEFTITTKSTELDLTEGFSVMAFYMYGGMYNIFNGTPVDNVHVDFVNASSGEIISSSDSKNLGSTESSDISE